MWKLIVIAVIAVYLVRKILRLLTLPTVSEPEAVELKACAYCGILVRIDKGVADRGFFFCCPAHAQRYFDEGRDTRV